MAAQRWRAANPERVRETRRNRPSNAYASEQVLEWRRRLRQAVIDRDKFCRLCGGDFKPGDIIQLDHIVPASVGGSNDQDNLRATHARCNHARGQGPWRKLAQA